jgi:hypothetical protein
MKNLKPSELPVDTVIAEKSWGKYDDLYIKREGVEGASDYWEDLFSGCGCCTDHERISDSGSEEDEDDLWMDPRKLTTTKTSNDYFEDFKVIALPPGYLIDETQLHGEWSRDKWTYSDGTGQHICPGVNCEAVCVN